MANGNVEMTETVQNIQSLEDSFEILTSEVKDFINKIQNITRDKLLNNLENIKTVRNTWKEIKAQYSIKYNKVEKTYKNSEGTIKNKFKELTANISTYKTSLSTQLAEMTGTNRRDLTKRESITSNIRACNELKEDIQKLQLELDQSFVAAERVYSEKIHSAMVKLKKNSIKKQINSTEDVNLNGPLFDFAKNSTTIEQKVEILKSLSKIIKDKNNEIKNYLKQQTIAFNNNNDYKNVMKGNNKNIATNVKMLESIIKGKEIVLQEIIKGLNVLTKEQIFVLKNRVTADRAELIKLKNSIEVKFGPITNNFTLKTPNFRTKKNQLLGSIQSLLGKVNLSEKVNNVKTGSEIGNGSSYAVVVGSENAANENAAKANAKANANANAAKFVNINGAPLSVRNKVIYTGNNGRRGLKGTIQMLDSNDNGPYAIMVGNNDKAIPLNKTKRQNRQN